MSVRMPKGAYGSARLAAWIIVNQFPENLGHRTSDTVPKAKQGLIRTCTALGAGDRHCLNLHSGFFRLFPFG